MTSPVQVSRGEEQESRGGAKRSGEKLGTIPLLGRMDRCSHVPEEVGPPRRRVWVRYRGGTGGKMKSEGLVGVSAVPMGQAQIRKSGIWGTLFEETLLILHMRLLVRQACSCLSPLSCSG